MPLRQKVTVKAADNVLFKVENQHKSPRPLHFPITLCASLQRVDVWKVY